MDSTRVAVIDSLHEIGIGYETFFFSSTDAMTKFSGNVVRYCGALTDPVTKIRFYPRNHSPHMYHNDREYYFQSDSTYSMFAMMPMDFANPAYQMLPKADSLKASG